MDYLAHLVADSRAIVEAALGHLDERVRACPDWDVGQLVGHLGRVQQFWAGHVERRETSEPGEDTPVPETPGRMMLLEWFLAGSERLQEVLAEADPDERVWTWFPPDQTVGFWRRRMAQEAAVHRWDVQDAAGQALPIDPMLAGDGIDEYLRVHLPATEQWQEPPGGYAGTSGTVAVHCTDVGADWFVDLRGTQPSVTVGHHKADALLRGPASDVLLVLWERLPVAAVEVLGDAALVEDLRAYVDTN